MADLSPEQLQGLADALTGTARSSNDLTKEQQNQVQRQKELQETLRKTREYFADLGSTLISTERGTSKYAGAITGATDAAAGVANQFGLLGITAGYVIKALGGLAAASLKQNDALIKTFRTLSDFGKIDFDPQFANLNDQLLRLGYTAETSQEFGNVLKNIAPELAMFGGTVTKGSEMFVDAGEQLTTTFQKELYNLGYTNEQILQYAGSSIARNIKNQTLLDKTTGGIATQSFGYLKTLTELTALTGASRDQAEEAAKAQQLEIGWRLKLAELPPGEQTKLRESMQMLLLTNKDMAMAIMDQIVNDGAVTTQNSARQMNIVGDSYLRIIEMSKRQGVDAVAETANILNNRLPAIDDFIRQFSTTGKISADAFKELGGSIGLLDSRARIAGMNEEAIKELRKQIDAAMAADGSRLAGASELEQSERNRRKLTEEATRAMGGLMVPAVTGFSGLLNEASLGLAKFIRTITYGTVDFVDNFRDFSNLQETKDAIADSSKKELALIQERTKAEQKLTTLLEDKSKKEKDITVTPAKKAEQLETINKDIAKAKEQLEEVKTGIKANSISKQRAEQAKNSIEAKEQARNQQPAVGPTGSSFAGLKIKGGAHTEGQQLDSRLPGLAKQIAEAFPEAYITSANDEYHRTGNIDPDTGKVRKSKHTTGEALDFALGSRPDKEKGAEIVKQLIGMGFKSARDEYNDRSKGSTGNHIHAELATGGVVRGPKTGYPAMLHGTEAVIPMNMMKDFGNQVTKFPLGGGNNADTEKYVFAFLGVLETIKATLMEMVEYQRATKFVQESILVQVKH